jgi:DNA-binding transcriptional LysR family regulator
MDLTHLRYFQSIAEAKSLSAAARQLHVSQPTLTVAIQNLEEELRTTLLLRTSRGVTLTASGEALLRSIGDIFALLERTKESIAGLETERVGEFVIGCHESLGAYFLPPFMRAFLEKAPKITLSLWNGPSSAVREAVLDRKVHFGLIVNPIPHADLVLVDLFQDGVTAFVASAEPPCESLEAAYDRIARGPLVFAGRVTQCREIISRLAAEGRLLPSRMLDCGDLELVKSLGIGGIGVALLPRRVALYGHERGLRELHAELVEIPDRIFLIYRSDVHRTRAALELKEALVSYGKSLEPPMETARRTT